MPSTPAGTGGSHSGGPTAMPSTSISKTTTEDRSDDQEAPQARFTAHASGRTPARGGFAGARSAEDGDRQAARGLASDALRPHRGEAACNHGNGAAAREALRRRRPTLAPSSERAWSASRPPTNPRADL